MRSTDMNRFYFIIGIIIGFCSVGQFVWANTAYIIDVTKVNFRSGPSTEHRVIATLSSGHPLEILGTEGNWSHVSFKQNGGSIKEVAKYFNRDPSTLSRRLTTLKQRLLNDRALKEEFESLKKSIYAFTQA